VGRHLLAGSCTSPAHGAKKKELPPAGLPDNPPHIPASILGRSVRGEAHCRVIVGDAPSFLAVVCVVLDFVVMIAH
jgi:hypothetical protein